MTETDEVLLDSMEDNLEEIEVKRRSQFKDIVRKLLKNRNAVFGLCVLIILLFLVIFADFIVDYDRAVRLNVSARLQPPNANYILGTDDLGRDLFARIVHGSRVSLGIATSVILTAVFIGSILGSVAAYYGGVIDNIIMRIIDVSLAIPSTILCIAIVAALGPSTVNMLIALVIAYIPGYSRVVRASVLSVKQMEYVEAARAIGAKKTRIIFHHLLLNSMGPIIIQTTLGVAGCILADAGFSFLGLGVQPPTPEWGAILAGGRSFIRTAPYILISPGIFIFMATLSFNLLGDGLRDALDPKLRR